MMHTTGGKSGDVRRTNWTYLFDFTILADLFFSNFEVFIGMKNPLQMPIHEPVPCVVIG